MKRTFHFLLACLVLAMLLAVSCRVPESLAPKVADKMLESWQSVSSIETVSEQYPDLVATPDKSQRVLTRVRDVQKSSYGYLNEILEPPSQAGSAAGGLWGSLWIFDARKGTLYQVSGLREFKPEANKRILTHVIGLSFRNYDFSKSSGQWVGRKTDIITSAPFKNNKYRWKTITESDQVNGYALRFRAFDDRGRELSGWDTQTYLEPKRFSDYVFQSPEDRVRKALSFTRSENDNLKEMAGALDFKPTLLQARSGIHSVQKVAQDVWGLFSDYSDPDESLYLTQWPVQTDQRLTIPCSRIITTNGRQVEFSLQGPFVVMHWISEGRAMIALGEMDIAEMFETLTPLF